MVEFMVHGLVHGLACGTWFMVHGVHYNVLLKDGGLFLYFPLISTLTDLLKLSLIFYLIMVDFSKLHLAVHLKKNLLGK